MGETETPYVLATGFGAVRRLAVLHEVYSPTSLRLLSESGISPGMSVLDLGCGTGNMSVALADLVGPKGTVTGIDSSDAQLIEARTAFPFSTWPNLEFIKADACDTGLPSHAYDLVYCRYLLMHLPNPTRCLQEIFRLLKPGGMAVIEDGDLTSVYSIPPTAIDTFATCFERLGESHEINYALGNDLEDLVSGVGLIVHRLEVVQPPLRLAEHRQLIEWSLAEAAPAVIDAGILNDHEMATVLAEMAAVALDDSVEIFPAKMISICARR